MSEVVLVMKQTRCASFMFLVYSTPLLVNTVGRWQSLEIEALYLSPRSSVVISAVITPDPDRR